MIKSIKDIFISSDSKELSLDDFNQLYKENRDFIRKSVYWMVRSQDVDDVVQDTFYKAWKNIHKFKQDSSFKTWIYKIAMNTCYDFLKKRQKHENKEIDQEASTNDQSDLRDLITKGLSHLKDKDREVFMLFYKIGYGQEEIAELTGLKLGTVKSKIHYAKKEFIAFLKENGVHHE